MQVRVLPRVLRLLLLYTKDYTMTTKNIVITGKCEIGSDGDWDGTLTQEQFDSAVACVEREGSEFAACYLNNSVVSSSATLVRLGNTVEILVTYEVSTDFNSTDADVLMKYTQGQWSDGIGEGLEQSPFYYFQNGDGLYLSMWYIGQHASVRIL